MNLYIRYFDEECVVSNVSEAYEFLSSIPGIVLDEFFLNDLKQYMESPMPYPKRYKVRPRVYFIVIKTTAKDLAEFKANGGRSAANVSDGIAKEMPLFGHMPYVMGEGKKKLSKRDPESNLFLHREHGFIPEGLLNYLALLGWSIAPDRDVFSMQEMIEKFDVRDVKANPAHFDLDKAISINAEHIRMLDEADFLHRSVSYLHRDGLVSADNWDALTDREREILTLSAPLVQPRVRLLGEVSGMAGSLLSTEGYIEPDADARKQLKESAGAVLDAAIAALRDVSEEDWKAEPLHALLDKVLVEEGGFKPRLAYGPVRVAMSGRRVSPPLFESMEIVGKEISLARLEGLREHL